MKKNFDKLRQLIQAEAGSELQERDRRTVVEGALAVLNILEQVANDLHHLAHHND